MLIPLKADSRFEFTNVNCTSYEKQIIDYEYCYLKSINRTYKYLSGKIKLYEVPLSNIKVNFRLWKRFNGYKPFLYNITLDLCKFLVTPKSSPVANFIYESFVEYSNMNHSCPFKNELYVEKLPVDFMNHRFTKILPFPEGDYLFEFLWIRSRSLIASAKIYCTVS
ncbi:uncharacterized protein LOC110186292 [Drosophila serrata]|uniref:uncharacterized protein LOC110186292 n=1 Tax=Drosophila serrata TaxID=7274 RepID=UPI000A1D1890|nr:uncharacterized protein LOC110186292 [Drosophila serrata]